MMFSMRLLLVHRIAAPWPQRSAATWGVTRPGDSVSLVGVWGTDSDPSTCRARCSSRPAPPARRSTALEIVPGEYGILLMLKVRQPAQPGHNHDHDWTAYQTLKVHDQHIVDIRPYPNRYSAVVRAGVKVDPASGTVAEGLTPILNVSSVVDSIAWFARLGWSKTFDWRGND